MEEILPRLKIFKSRLGDLAKILDIPKMKVEIVGLEKESEEPDFWQNPENAKDTLKNLEQRKKELSDFENLAKEIADLEDSIKLVSEVPDKEMEADTRKRFAILQKNFSAFEFKTLFTEKYDSGSAIMAIHAGAGGTDAQDWAQMLLRMYLKFSEMMDFTAKIIDQSWGKEAGVKSVTIEILGHYAYGYLKSEAGVHRLVRISPFDAEAMRHTSFALVELLPEIGEISEVKIDPRDLRVDTFRSSGPGGQYTNKTESAVRVTHIPTGIVVACQSERSQLQNRETAMKILRAKLHQRFLAKRESKKKKIRGEFKSAEWGNQIRSYVLHPYKLVKDHRTGYETSDIGKVLDGGIIEFVKAYLKQTGKK